METYSASGACTRKYPAELVFIRRSALGVNRAPVKQQPSPDYGMMIKRRFLLGQIKNISISEAFMATNRPFIRDGNVVRDATPEERQAASQSRFPGVGRRLQDSQPVVPVPPRGGPVVLHAVSGGDDPPEPPGDGSTTASATLAPTFEFISSACSWPSVDMVALRLLPLLEPALILHALRRRENRIRLFQMLLEGRIEEIPPPMPRTVFHPDPDFQESDIGSRAIVELQSCFNLAAGLDALRSTLLSIATYRQHPLAQNLTLCLHGNVARGQRVQISFPSESGEVMYVITTSYHVVIGARSGHQRDLPHPTLIGGDDPEVLSAGLVFFRNGRIVRIFINASGHFKPNDMSSIEASLLAFSVLPAEAFHPQFEGFQVFCHGGHFMIEGPVPTGGSNFDPFDVAEGEDLRGTVEQTNALRQRSQMADISKFVESRTITDARAALLQRAQMPEAFNKLAHDIKKVLNGLLMHSLSTLSSNNALRGLMTHAMRVSYNELLLLMMKTPEDMRKRVLGPDARFKKLVDDFLER